MKISVEVLILMEIGLLFYAGMVIGTSIHNLDAIKVVLMENPHDTSICYIPLTGLELTLPQFWDLTLLYIYLCFFCACLISIHLGFLINKLTATNKGRVRKGL